MNRENESLLKEMRLHWWQRAPRIPTLALFAVVALALIGTFSLIIATVEVERTQRQQAARTSGIIASLDEIVRATMSGETGQRGYFITSDTRYLEPYREGQGRYAAGMRALRDRMGPDLPAEQANLVAEIARLGDAKWAEMAGVVDLVEQRRIPDAHARLLSDEGQLAMNGLRKAVARLEDIERVRLDQAAQRAANAEARILPSLAALFVVIVCALALGLWQAIRKAEAEALAEGAAAIAEARDRADLLAKELNHRVKNLFAVILAIVKMSARGDAAAAPAVDRIAKRIHALVTAHEVTQGSGKDQTVDLAELIGKVIAPYRSSSERCELDGGTVNLPGRHAVPLGLVLHELATNAVKYGAWSAPGGLLRIRWESEDSRAKVIWEEIAAGEAAGPTEQGREGFGSALIRSSERQLGGTIVRRFEARGIVVEMDFTLEGGEA
ncbi:MULTISPECIES: sensor histidine kinase [Novosphingobium]|jgi:two-component sensor histidine kinase|uniref:histidine kinase n=1 Tax=Novosphingobium subterraneum TaxID=48936 RepID=A0A0B9A475_9SPHN|nr:MULTISPECIES: CHASE3 domain-containing protein [Novosphingobium]KHS44125.1 signal transduction histidine kinase [Novosphingobium subterraneum]QOV94216.1 CHASE3 domain-containing protein [Novosphingobium sp. ES2-1]